jgi:hypothetical protein
VIINIDIDESEFDGSYEYKIKFIHDGVDIGASIAEIEAIDVQDALVQKLDDGFGFISSAAQ